MFLNCYSPLFQSPQNVIFMVSVAFMQIPKLSRRTAAEAPPPPKLPRPSCRTAAEAAGLRRGSSTESGSSTGLPARQSHGKLTNETSIFVWNLPASEMRQHLRVRYLCSD